MITRGPRLHRPFPKCRCSVSAGSPIRSDAVRVSRLRTVFHYSKMQDVKKRVRDMALKAARDKAEQIASAMGVEVGQLRAVRENRYGHWKGGRWRWGAEANVVSNDFVAIPSSGASADKAVRPDAIKMFLSVDVTFAIR